jgi:hypothetical protein
MFNSTTFEISVNVDSANQGTENIHLLATWIYVLSGEKPYNV